MKTSSMGSLWRFLVPILTIESVTLQGCDMSRKVVTPTDQTPWQQTRGPYVGTVLQAFVDPPSRIVVGTQGLGAFESSDNAGNWKNAGFGTNSWLMSFGKSFDGIYYAGSYQGEIFRSRNPDDGWEQTPYFRYGNAIRGFAFTSKGSAFAAGDDGVFRTSDGGSTWVEADSGILFRAGGTIAANSFDQLFVAGIGPGIYRSTNDGNNWQLLNSGLPNESVTAILPLDSARIIVGTRDGVYRSSDDGAHWERMGGMDAGASSLAVDDQGIVYGSSYDGLFSCIFTADHWQFITRAVQSTPLAISPQIGLLACTQYQGLLQSRDKGRTWMAIGVPVAEVTGVALSPSGDVFASVASSGAFKYIPETRSWIQTAAISHATTIAISPSGGIFVGKDPGAVHSLDGGATWRSDAFTTRVVNGFGFGRNEMIFAGTDGDGVYRSSDQGVTWGQANNGLVGMRVRSIATAPTGNIYAGTNSGVHLSTDNGNSWEPVTSIYFDITSVLLLPDGTIAAGTASNGIYRSTSQTPAWASINNGLTDLRIKQLIFTRFGTLLVLTPSSVFRSSDYGNIWSKNSEGLPPYPYTSIVEDLSGNIMVGTLGGGCFTRTKD